MVVNGQVQKDWGLHLIDVNLAMGNLVEIVREQSEGVFEEVGPHTALRKPVQGPRVAGPPCNAENLDRMRYLALCCDYDGTIAHHGRVDEPTLAALERLRESGRKLVLVTGRELDELQTVFPHLDLFERVVAENGALIYRPATREERLLGEAPPQTFVDKLHRARRRADLRRARASSRRGSRTRTRCWKRSATAGSSCRSSSTRAR